MLHSSKYLYGVTNGSILTDEKGPPPSPPDQPSQVLTKEQLLPPTPSIYLDNKKQAFSPQLQEFCLKNPIAVVRGIAAALKLGKRQQTNMYFKTEVCVCIRNTLVAFLYTHFYLRKFFAPYSE